MQETVKDRLIKFIETTGLTDEKFAAKAKVSRQIINLWRRNRAYPSPDKILKIIEIFDELDANWLLRGHKTDEEGKIIPTIYAKTPTVSNLSDGSLQKLIYEELKDNYEKQIAFLKRQIEFLQLQISPDFKSDK